MYGYPRDTSVNLVRTKMLKKMVGEDNDLTKDSKVDLSKLPPCRNSLIPHIHRVNHRVCNYKRANIPIFEKPKPSDPNQGWMTNESGMLEPQWTIGPCLPQSLIDLMDKIPDEKDDGEDELEEMKFTECDSDDEDDGTYLFSNCNRSYQT